MAPPWMRSRGLTQRTSVLLPDPEGPMIAIVVPEGTSRSTPRSTSSAPNRLTTLPKRIAGSGFAMALRMEIAARRQPARQISHGRRHHQHEQEINDRDGGLHGHRQERRADDEACLVHEIRH